MVVKAEAICPYCLNDQGYTVPLEYGQINKEFNCTNCSKKYVEDKNGFLVSKK